VARHVAGFAISQNLRRAIETGVFDLIGDDLMPVLLRGKLGPRLAKKAAKRPGSQLSISRIEIGPGGLITKLDADPGLHGAAPIAARPMWKVS
jgi:hypothetical protein